MYVHVISPDGEAKYWLDPEIELAKSYRLSDRDLNRIRQIILGHEEEIRDAWHAHFGS